jgi:hypothetical protein
MRSQAWHRPDSPHRRGRRLPRNTKALAAVLSPRTLIPSRKINPAPRKPMPDTTCAATRVGLASPGTSAANTTKLAAPKATSVLVRNPARRLRHCRSKPMAALRQKATARLMAACPMEIVMADDSCWGNCDHEPTDSRTALFSPIAPEFGPSRGLCAERREEFCVARKARCCRAVSRMPT